MKKKEMAALIEEQTKKLDDRANTISSYQKDKQELSAVIEEMHQLFDTLGVPRKVKDPKPYSYPEEITLSIMARYTLHLQNQLYGATHHLSIEETSRG